MDDEGGEARLDPLGLQTTSVALYQQLMPGISNVTLRMRSYGFFSARSREDALNHVPVCPEAAGATAKIQTYGWEITSPHGS